MNWPAPTDEHITQRAARDLLSERYGVAFMGEARQKPEPERTHDAADEFIDELAEFFADHPIAQVWYQQFVERKRNARDGLEVSGG